MHIQHIYSATSIYTTHTLMDIDGYDQLCKNRGISKNSLGTHANRAKDFGILDSNSNKFRNHHRWDFANAMILGKIVCVSGWESVDVSECMPVGVWVSVSVGESEFECVCVWILVWESVSSLLFVLKNQSFSWWSELLNSGSQGTDSQKSFHAARALASFIGWNSWRASPPNFTCG